MSAADQKKKKGKFEKITIADLDNEKKLLPGRVECDCMTTKHGLINNCLVCGRIVCEQEGEGACFFCGNPVHLKGNALANEEFMSLQDSRAKADSAQLKAVEHKNKLLGFQKNQTNQSNIIDDDTDWYEISDNVWLSENQRNFAAQKIKEEERKKEEEESGIRIAFDTTTGKFVAGKSEYDPNKAIEEAQTFLQKIGSSGRMSQKEIDIHSDLSEQIRKQYQDQIKSSKKKGADGEVTTTQPKIIEDIFEEFKAAVQDKAFQEAAQTENIFDEEIFPLDSQNGSCLSMHQPWASLVVYGIKRFEGRMWTSRYRGPLWIQAGSKVPTAEEIKMVEDQYKRLYKDVKDMPPFPERYPTGSLLGVIDLEDIVRVEDYMKYIPDEKREETGCKYLFVCRNPRKLLYPIKMPGEREIFKIDKPDVIEKGLKNLIKMRTNWYPYYADLLRGKERCPDEELELDSMRLEYKPEDIGMIVNGFLSGEVLSDLAENLLKVLKQNDSKYIGKTYTKTLPIGELGTFGARVKKYVPLMVQKKLRQDRSEFEDKISSVDFFLLGDKDKGIKIEKHYSVLLVLGKPVKFWYETHKKKLITLGNGSLVLLNSDKRMVLTVESIEKGENTEEAKNLASITEGNPLFVLMSAGRQEFIM